MNYDDYKLATPPDFDNETVYEYCDDCDKKFESDELNNVLIDLVPFTLCKNCKNKAENLITHTQIMIAPGYSFRMIQGLITNFHQPQSTLLLLVAAITGPAWKDIYAHALENGFRFLSYGDGCLFEV